MDTSLSYTCRYLPGTNSSRYKVYPFSPDHNKLGVEMIVPQGVCRNRNEQAVRRSPPLSDFGAVWFWGLFSHLVYPETKYVPEVSGFLRTDSRGL